MFFRRPPPPDQTVSNLKPYLITQQDLYEKRPKETMDLLEIVDDVYEYIQFVKKIGSELGDDDVERAVDGYFEYLKVGSELHYDVEFVWQCDLLYTNNYEKVRNEHTLKEITKLFNKGKSSSSHELSEEEMKRKKELIVQLTDEFQWIKRWYSLEESNPSVKSIFSDEEQTREYISDVVLNYYFHFGLLARVNHFGTLDSWSTANYIADNKAPKNFITLNPHILIDLVWRVHRLGSYSSQVDYHNYYYDNHKTNLYYSPRQLKQPHQLTENIDQIASKRNYAMSSYDYHHHERPILNIPTFNGDNEHDTKALWYYMYHSSMSEVEPINIEPVLQKLAKKDAIVSVLAHLSPAHSLNLGLVCKKWREYSISDGNWRHRVEEKRRIWSNVDAPPQSQPFSSFSSSPTVINAEEWNKELEGSSYYEFYRNTDVTTKRRNKLIAKSRPKPMICGVPEEAREEMDGCCYDFVEQLVDEMWEVSPIVCDKLKYKKGLIDSLSKEAECVGYTEDVLRMKIAAQIYEISIL